MKKTTSGFTIIELLVVIVTLGILATVSIVSYNGVQTNTRNSQRESRTALLAEALEKYYDKNGEYPSCAAMTAPSNTVASVTLPGIDPTILTDPKAAVGTNSITCNINPAPNTYSYVGGADLYRLKYQKESDSNITTIKSRRISIAFNVVIVGAGGGGGGGSYYCNGGAGGDGGLSSISYGLKSFKANGGKGGSNCPTHGANGDITITNSNSFVNTASPAVGGGATGGYGSTDWQCPQCDPTDGGNGGNGGKISGIIKVSEGATMNIVVGQGGYGGAGMDTIVDGEAGNNGIVTISYTIGAIEGTGGSSSTNGSIKTHTFTNSGTFSFTIIE